jgi:hypothetical protein
MNLRAMLGLGSLLIIGTACPHDWARGGTNDRAMAKDTREMLDVTGDDEEEDCPEGLTLKPDCTKRLSDGSCPVTCQ